MIRTLMAAAVVGVLLVPAPANATAVGCRLADGRITEASSLVDLGSVLVTANDSGDSARVFVLDPHTCATRGVTTYAGTARDVEALAPAGPHAVWVGDLGDNREDRGSVSVVRIPIAPGDHRVAGRRFALRYPDGPHDAESLVADRSGRLFVVTKAFAGGALYAAPRVLRADRANLLVRRGRVGVWATDAALSPDDRWLVVRGYLAATVYSFPGLKRVGAFALPVQPQGEGLSIGRTGRVLVDTEGVHSRVEQVALPAGVRRLLVPHAAPSPSPRPSARPTPSPAPDAETPAAHPAGDRTPRDHTQRDLALGIGLAGLAGLTGYILWQRRR